MICTARGCATSPNYIITMFAHQDLASSDNIDTYLTNFCVWQHNKRSYSRGLTPRWDHALLLSGYAAKLHHLT